MCVNIVCSNSFSYSLNNNLRQYIYRHTARKELIGQDKSFAGVKI